MCPQNCLLCQVRCRKGDKGEAFIRSSLQDRLYTLLRSEISVQSRHRQAWMAALPSNVLEAFPSNWPRDPPPCSCPCPAQANNALQGSTVLQRLLTSVPVTIWSPFQDMHLVTDMTYCYEWKWAEHHERQTCVLMEGGSCCAVR